MLGKNYISTRQNMIEDTSLSLFENNYNPAGQMNFSILVRTLSSTDISMNVDGNYYINNIYKYDCSCLIKSFCKNFIHKR